jgi:hypothetical protein
MNNFIMKLLSFHAFQVLSGLILGGTDELWSMSFFMYLLKLAPVVSYDQSYRLCFASVWVLF